MVGMSVCVCLEVLLMWSWGGEKAAPGLLGSEPCGGDSASTWCGVGQWQVQLEVVLRVWDVLPERLCRHNAVGGFRNLVFHSSSRAGKDVLVWCMACLVFSEVSPDWHDCIWVQAGE